MDHLKYLSWANYLLAALFLVAFGLCALSVVAQVGMTLSAGGELGPILPGLAATVCAAIGLGTGALLYLLTGRGVARGQRRGLQSLMALLSICNCPGIFYTAYALWVCYGNEPTKAAFEEGGLA